MYALRHPCLPFSQQPSTSTNTSSSPSDLYRSRADAAVASLFPGPSVPGLAFACCAASLPLLQSRDTTVGRAVRALLSVALPLVLEPRLSQATNESDVGMLVEVEHGRLQYLLNRVEQVHTDCLIILLSCCTSCILANSCTIHKVIYIMHYFASFHSW